MDAGGFIEGITDNLTVENCLIVDDAGQVVARISTEEYQDDDEFLSCAASAWANGISIFSYSGEKWHITATESG